MSLESLLKPTDQPFLRFPLPILASGLEPCETFDNILAWCCRDVGRKLRDKSGLERHDLVELAQFPDVIRAGMWKQVDPDDDDQFFTYLGAVKLRVTLGPAHFARLAGCLDLFFEDQLEEELMSATEMRTYVNLTSDVYWAASNHADGIEAADWLTWDQFRVFCAIQSKLGKKGWGECGWQEIQARAAGWNRKLPTLDKRVKAWREPLILSRKQIRNIVELLWDTGRFARWSRRGEAWYGLGMDEETLIRQVLTRKSKRRALHEAKLARQRAIVDKVKAELQQPPLKPAETA